MVGLIKIAIYAAIFRIEPKSNGLAQILIAAHLVILCLNISMLKDIWTEFTNWTIVHKYQFVNLKIKLSYLVFHMESIFLYLLLPGYFESYQICFAIGLVISFINLMIIYSGWLCILNSAIWIVTESFIWEREKNRVHFEIFQNTFLKKYDLSATSEDWKPKGKF